MRRQVSLGLLLVGCLAFLLCTSTASGQAVFGSIDGTVTDPQGNAVAGAKVTVTSTTKATTFEATTNESGNYTVTHLIPDTYKVKVEAQGFKAYEVASVTLSADTTTRVDAQVQVGAVTQTVEVTSEVPQLKTDRADVSIEFNTKYVGELPILNRNFTSFELLAPGTEKLAWTHAATENPQASEQIMVDGQHFSGTAYELDGTDNQDPILGIIVVNPNLDAIQEAKVTLQNYDAEFGKAVAGVVTVQTKSGTNEIHGSAFWDRYTDATRARDPFTQAKPDISTGKLLPSIKFNQFGGTVGGPIVKNKLFFFGDYQGTRSSFGVTNQLTIPTSNAVSTCVAALGNPALFCDLHEYAPKIGNGKAGDSSNYIYDPASSAALDGSGRKVFCGPSGIVAPASCPAANNFLIPGNRLSPQAIAILKDFPSPGNTSLTTNYIKSGPGPFVQNSFDTREDYNISPTLMLFGRFSLARFSVSGTGALGKLGGPGSGGAPSAAGLNGSSVIHNYSLASGVTKTFNPTLIADFRFGYFKYNPVASKSDANATPMTTLYNVPNMNTSDPSTGGLPSFHMDGVISDFGDGLGVGRCNCPLTESEQQFQWVTNWTKIRGNHTFKFGADVRYAMNLRVPSDANRTGEPVFKAATTSNGGSGGLDLATFLLGDVSEMDRYVNCPTCSGAAERQKRYFFYAQDTFRFNSKLTFNYGLRWEFYPPEYVNAKGNGGFANLTDGFIHVGGYGAYGLNGNVDNNWKLLSPRVGIAYQIRPKTVIRMGYGRSYDMGVFGSNFGHSVTQNLPVLVRQHVDATNSDITGGSGNPGASVDKIPAFTLAQGPPIFVFTPIPANGLLPLLGPQNNVSTHIRPTYQRLPTLDAWNATVQHQLTGTLNIEVAYVGNKGTNSFPGDGPSYNPNQVGVSPGTSFGGSFVPAVSQNSRRPFFNKYTYQSFLDASGNPLKCCTTDFGNYYGNDSSTSYNALTIKVEKRFSQGLQFLSHYTYSRSYNYDKGGYANNPKLAYGPDDTNRNHAFIASVVYALPFGKGQKYVGSAGRLEDLLVGGWQLSSSTNWSGGSAFTPSYGECGQDQDVNVCRPDIASGAFSLGVHRDPATGIVTYFTPIPSLAINAPATTDYCTVARPSGSGFARPACGTVGNFPRDGLRGPHAFMSDMSLYKSFGITERVKGAFRFDAFNVFNHVVMGNPGNNCIDCSGPSTGGDAGKITDINGNAAMRQLQFGLRFTF